jgi:outer membrane receptor protein involved in Fe transport
MIQDDFRLFSQRNPRAFKMPLSMTACVYLVLTSCLWAQQQQPAPPPPQPSSADPSQPQPQPKLEPIQTSITVTGQITTETPAAITVVNSLALEEVPGVNIDDRLRVVPGFTLFKRNSSVAANPTTQGVSLRGIGSTGASRTLLLWDGIPLNDPFGGWVYWDRISPTEVDRIEISRGASTSVFGDLAMGGAINIFSRPPEPFHVSLGYDGGNENTNEITAAGSYRRKWFGVSANTRFLSTDGYFIVPAANRGSVDRPAGVDFAAGVLRLDFLGPRDRLFVRLDTLAEERANGTALVKNSTSLGTLAANYSHQMDKDSFSVLGYRTQEVYRANYSSVAADRNSERLTENQIVPAVSNGGAAFWTHTERSYNFLAGGDANYVDGVSTDLSVAGVATVGGGTRLEHGVFGQANATWKDFRFFGGLRYDVTGLGENFVSPSGGIVYGRKRFRLRGSVYQSFRTPTLNELYRDFRAGNTNTLPNPLLKPETVFGSEAGIDWVGEKSRISVTGYRNDLGNLITNVTLSTTPALITRERENAASALARGVEVSGKRDWGPFHGELAYLFADSRVATGQRIPEVPKHQGSAQLSYVHKGTTVALVARSASLQFDDDKNTLLLGGYATEALTIRQRLRRGFTASLGIENVLDRQYWVTISTVPNVGPPRLIRAGIRWER